MQTLHKATLFESISACLKIKYELKFIFTKRLPKEIVLMQIFTGVYSEPCQTSNIERQKQSPRGVLCKKVFLETSQNSQENTCTRVSFLIKLLWQRCFPVLRTPFLQNTSGRLLLERFAKIVNG